MEKQIAYVISRGTHSFLEALLTNSRWLLSSEGFLLLLQNLELADKAVPAHNKLHRLLPEHLQY